MLRSEPVLLTRCCISRGRCCSQSSSSYYYGKWYLEICLAPILVELHRRTVSRCNKAGVIQIWYGKYPERAFPSLSFAFPLPLAFPLASLLPLFVWPDGASIGRGDIITSDARRLKQKTSIPIMQCVAERRKYVLFLVSAGNRGIPGDARGGQQTKGGRLGRLRSITINELIRDLASDAIFRMNLLMAFDMASTVGRVDRRPLTARKIWGLVRTAGGSQLSTDSVIIGLVV